MSAPVSTLLLSESVSELVPETLVSEPLRSETLQPEIHEALESRVFGSNGFLAPTMTPEQFAEIMPDATCIQSCEPEMESSLHYSQLALLVSCLEWLWEDRTDIFIGADLTIYYSRERLKKRDFKGPDLFVVKNTINHPRNSWVVWEEDGLYPDFILEVLSESNSPNDRIRKKTVYQNNFRTPEYFWFSPHTLEFQGHRLVNRRYETIAPEPSGLIWSQELELYLGIHEEQLRYFNPDGQLVLTPREAARQARLEAHEARLEAEEARLNAQREAEEARLEAQREAEEIRLEAQKEAEEARLEAERKIQAAQNAKLAAEQELQKLRDQLLALGVEPNI